MTPTQQLIELRIGGDLAGFVDRCRARGLSWRQIANEVNDKAHTDITYETLRSWYGPRTEQVSA